MWVGWGVDGGSLVKGLPGGELARGNFPGGWPRAPLKPSSHREGPTDLSGSVFDGSSSWETEGLQSHSTFFFLSSNLKTKSLTPDLCFISAIRNRMAKRWIKVVGKMKRKEKLGNAFKTLSLVSVQEAGVPSGQGRL